MHVPCAVTVLILFASIFPMGLAADISYFGTKNVDYGTVNPWGRCESLSSEAAEF